MDDYTAYVNPYFVVQKGRFTKHYFEGSSRIVSKLGEGTFHHNNRGISAGGIDYIRQSAQMQEARDRYIKGSLTPPGPPTQHGIYASPEWTGQPYPSLGWQNIRQDQEPPEGWPRPPKFNEPGDVPGPPVQYGDPITPQTVKAGYGFIDNGIIEKNLYFYHPDHLGSSSYITDREGRITQHTEYIAFGEVLFEEHSTSKTMPYLFNGKELDSETNLTYFGERYLDMKSSLWLNIDPLAEKYPHVSPYTYTLNNPIKFIDPDGRDPITGIVDALSSFALDVGIDFLGGILIEGKSIKASYNDIGWWSAGINAVGAYAVSAVTPTGTSTTLKISKLMSNKKLKQVAILLGDIVGKMTTKAIDKYSQGKYNDENGEFSFDQVDIEDLFWESSIETLIEKGFSSKAENIMKELTKQDKIIGKKMKTLQDQVSKGTSKKITKGIARDIQHLQNKNSETINNYLKEKTKEKITIGSVSKMINESRNNNEK